MKMPVQGLTSTLLSPLAASVGVNVGIIACYVLQAVLTAEMLHRLMQDGAAAAVMPPLIAMGIAVMVRAALIALSEVVAQRIGMRCKVNLRQRLLAQLLYLGPGVGLVPQSADLQGTVTRAVEAVEGYYSRYLPALLSALLGCTLVLGVMAWFDLPSALLLALFVIAFPLLDSLWMRWQMPQATGVFSAMAAFAATLLDALQGLVTLKAFGASAAWRAKLAQDAATLRRASMETLKVTLMRGGITRLVSLSGIALVLAFNAWRVAEQQIAPLTLLISLFLVREAFRPLNKLENAFDSAWAASGAQAPIAALLAQRPRVAEPAQPLAAPTRGDLRVEALSFAYCAGQPVLEDVSFTIKERQCVALVGPSGAGKSTLASLLLRCVDPTQGAIYLGGVDIRRLPLRTLRSMISVVSQDVFLFAGSIADNLRLAKPDASDEALHKAMQAAQMADFIAQLPDGYATQIGERGAQLSGGQRQRLAIARALLKDAPILLLDEATSSIDPRSEQALRHALAQFGGRRTVIAIAHRLESIKQADHILVFEGGRLVEQGQHHTLSQAGGCYARLLAAQGGEQ